MSVVRMLARASFMICWAHNGTRATAGTGRTAGADPPRSGGAKKVLPATSRHFLPLRNLGKGPNCA